MKLEIGKLYVATWAFSIGMRFRIQKDEVVMCIRTATGSRNNAEPGLMLYQDRIWHYYTDSHIHLMPDAYLTEAQVKL